MNLELSNATFLYPNPSDHQVTIQLPDFVSFKKVSFINQLGQTVKMSDKEITDVSNLMTGIYQVIIETSDGIAHKKFIKN